MLALFDPLRDLNYLSVALRMLLAVLCGGAIGMERTYKRRAAGFRTHILICLGAAMTTLTGQYLLLELHYYTDISRLGAQVVAGVGFIGAGCIIVTRRSRVKGLTTAAGLWVAAIIGLALGSGFYEGGLLTTLIVLLAEFFFSKLEYKLLEGAPELNLYMEYDGRSCLERVLKHCRSQNMQLLDLEITRSGESGTAASTSCAILTLRLSRHTSPEDTRLFLEQLRRIKGVAAAEEL